MNRLLALLDLVPGGSIVRTVAGIILRPVGAVWRWMIADYHRPLIVAFGAVILAHWLLIDPAVRDDRDDALAQLATTRTALVAEQAAHAGTIAQHKQAARSAEAAQAANLVRVKAEQTAINERTVDDYQARLDALRARTAALSGRLQQGAAAVDARLSGAARLSGPSLAASGVAGTTTDHGLPAAGNGAALVCTPMSLDERLAASEQAAQLDALIDWARSQAGLSTAP